MSPNVSSNFFLQNEFVATKNSQNKHELYCYCLYCMFQTFGLCQFFPSTQVFFFFLDYIGEILVVILALLKKINE